MSSSISNSRRALLIALLVALAIVAIEVFTRTVLFTSSKDLRRFSEYPARAQALMSAPAPRVAFFGNSITERAIDSQQFARDLDVSSELFVADSSHVNTWIWMIEAELWKRSYAPELIVITFHDGSLDDGARLEIGRLAQFFSEPEDWGCLFATELHGLDERAEYVLSSLWATYAVRDRLKERLFKLAPGYREYVAFQNEAARAMETMAKPRTARSRTFATLERLLAKARAGGSNVLVVAFPTRSSYEVSPGVLEAVRKHGMTFLDLRSMPELDHELHFEDDLHLNAVGRGIYTRRLAAEVRRLGLVARP